MRLLDILKAPRDREAAVIEKKYEEVLWPACMAAAQVQLMEKGWAVAGLGQSSAAAL